MKRFENFDLNLIRNKEWYHQRFDGCPMFLFAVGEAETTKESRKPAGTEADIRISFFGHGKGDWYLDVKDIKRGANAIIRLAKKDPDISKKLLKAWKHDEEKFEEFFWNDFPKVNLKQLTNTQLIEFWNNYYSLFSKRFTSSSIIDHFALGTDELIEKMINEESKNNKVFSIATAPVHQSFINKSEIDLLKIILGKSKESLESYQKRYFWIKNNYNNSYILQVKDFESEVKRWKNGKKDLTEELRKVESTPTINKQRKQQLLKEYKFSKLLRTLITISEDFTWWQDERKRSTYLNIHMGTIILKEISRRTGFTLEQLKYAVAPEISNIFTGNFPTKKELIARSRNSVFIMSRQGFMVKAGQQVETIRKIVLSDKKQEQVNDFRGLSASTGVVRGHVKIVKSATEIGKVKIGDILVAVMTRPDYVMGMKKAAAIVTNEGGITSHAAIVSRELGIPCIIGTKIATEVLKDGDMVEVNANHGWVRKI